MNGQLKVIPSVFTAVLRDGQILLLRRANTGWIDGWYDLPAGHLEDQEKLKDGAARELKEETGLEASPKDLRLIHIHQNHNQAEDPHYGYIFKALRWKGNPRITEPDKCDDVQFFPLDKLPDKISPYTKEALEHINDEEVSLSYHGPGSIDKEYLTS